VTHVSEVLKYALVSEPEAIHWDEAAEEAAALAAAKALNAPAATAH
jgi:ATP-dependent Lon protease